MAKNRDKTIAGACTIAASVISTWHIYKHLCNYTKPMYQRYIVRIIFMIHVYAFMSFLALARPNEAIYYNCICGIYEAWVIYNFLSLCIAFIGGPGRVATSLQGRYLKPSWYLMTCCCSAISLDGVFIRRCKRGVLQFVILKLLLVGATLLLYEAGTYEDGSFSIESGYLYITTVYTVSYTVALAALVLFYVACKDMLMPFQPLPKFLIIKSIVFLTFWQGFLIALLANGGVFKTARDALDAQNTTICVEMLFAAIGHLYAFPYEVYTDANINGPAGRLQYSILHALNFSDLVYDAMHQFAPTYHEYVLYSDGSQDAPQRDREQGQEMEMARKSNSKPWQPGSSFEEPGAAAGGGATSSNEASHITAEMQQESTTAAASDARTAAPGRTVTSHADNRASGSRAKTLLGANNNQRDSFSEEEANELTKLTNRRTSIYGPLMDTIDLRGENEEYSEGFIQR